MSTPSTPNATEIDTPEVVLPLVLPPKRQKRPIVKRCKRCHKPLGPNAKPLQRVCKACKLARKRECDKKLAALYKVIGRGSIGQKLHPLVSPYEHETATPVTWKTTALPGTPGKIEVMRKRYQRGETLHHPEDARRRKE